MCTCKYTDNTVFKKGLESTKVNLFLFELHCKFHDEISVDCPFTAGPPQPPVGSGQSHCPGGPGGPCRPGSPGIPGSPLFPEDTTLLESEINAGKMKAVSLPAEVVK